MPHPDEYGGFPLRQYLDMVVEGIGPGHAHAVVEIAEQHLNPNGVVHGAVLFTMVDTAMGMATMSLLPEGQFCSTVDVQMRFIRPVNDGRIVADTTVLRRGRTVVHLQSRVSDDHDRLVATAEGTFTIITPNPSPFLTSVRQ